MTAKKSPSKKPAPPKYPTAREAELRKMFGEDEHRHLASLVRAKVQKDNTIRTLVDPHLKHNLINLQIGKLFFTEFPERGEDYMTLASRLIYHIKNDSVNDLRRMFSAIVTMKENAEKVRDKDPSRYATATQALKEFLKIQKDDSWFTIDFDRYLIEQTKDMEGVSFPPLYPRTNWKRIHKILLIDDRVKRTGKKKVTKGKGKAT